MACFLFWPTLNLQLVPGAIEPGEKKWPNQMERKEAERELAAQNGLDRGGKYDCLWNNSVFISHDELPEEAKAFAARRTAYREQVKKQTGGKFHRLGGGNG